MTIIILAAMLTVPSFAARITVNVTNGEYGSYGKAYLNSYTGSSYADTIANSNGNELVSVELFVNYSSVAKTENRGSNYTTAVAVYPGSGTTAQGIHLIDRYINGTLVRFRAFPEVTL